MKRWKQIGVMTLILLCLTACKNKSGNKGDLTKELIKDHNTGINDLVNDSQEEYNDQKDDTGWEENVIILNGQETDVVSYDEELGNYYLNGLIYQILDQKEAVVISFYEYGITNLDIPSELKFEGETYPVTIIGAEAFYYYNDLVKVIMPDSITSIGDDAFYGCSELKEIKLSTNLVYIGNCAFYGCRSLNEIQLPQGLEMIGSEAFAECEELKEITLSDSVKNVGSEAFYGCIKLEVINLSNNMSVLSDGLFTNCEELGQINIPDGILLIGDEVFWNCMNLNELILPDSIVSIGSNAFYNCGIKTITIPSDLMIEDNGIFSFCDNLETIYVSGRLLDYYKELLDYWEYNIVVK